jgi:hypothetical protein
MCDVKPVFVFGILQEFRLLVDFYFDIENVQAADWMWDFQQDTVLLVTMTQSEDGNAYHNVNARWNRRWNVYDAWRWGCGREPWTL